MGLEPSHGQKRYIPYLPLTIKSILIVLVIFCIWIDPVRSISFDNKELKKVDKTCSEFLEQSLERATISYGVCRATNSLVSMLQEIEIGFELGFVGTLNPFEFLDPLNDLVERFSWVLLLSMISIGIQIFLIEFLPGPIITFLLLPGLIFWVVGLWANQYSRINILGIGKHLVLLGIVLRFIIPAEVAISNWIYNQYLKNKYNEAIQIIKTGNEEIADKSPIQGMVLEKSDDEKSPPQTGYFTSLKNKWSSSAKKTQEMYDAIKDLPSKLNDFKAWVEDMVPALLKNFISLVIIFIINTIFLPIFTLWLIVYLLKIVTNTRIGNDLEQKFKHNIFKKKKKGTLTSTR